MVGTSSPIFCTIKMYEGLTQRTTVQIGEILEPFGNINSRNEGLTEIPAENKNDLFSSLLPSYSFTIKSYPLVHVLYVYR